MRQVFLARHDASLTRAIIIFNERGPATAEQVPANLPRCEFNFGAELGYIFSIIVNELEVPGVARVELKLSQTGKLVKSGRRGPAVQLPR